MITLLKILIKDRDKMVLRFEQDSSLYNCKSVVNIFEYKCMRILELSNKLYPEKDRAVIEWDGLDKGSFVGDHRDIILDCIMNEYNRN